MSTPVRVQIPRKLYDAMIAQAFAELPNECVGLLAAKAENRGDSIRVERRYPLVNALAGPVEYTEDLCSENNMHVYIGKEGYFVSGDGYLMPTKKDQPPPDLRYFKQTAK